MSSITTSITRYGIIKQLDLTPDGRLSPVHADASSVGALDELLKHELRRAVHLVILINDDQRLWMLRQVLHQSCPQSGMLLRSVCQDIVQPAEDLHCKFATCLNCASSPWLHSSKTFWL